MALGYMVSRGFPVANFGILYGLLALSVGLGQISGPVVISWIAASKGGYPAALVAMFATVVIALLLALTLPEQRFRISQPGRL